MLFINFWSSISNKFLLECVRKKTFWQEFAIYYYIDYKNHFIGNGLIFFGYYNMSGLLLLVFIYLLLSSLWCWMKNTNQRGFDGHFYIKKLFYASLSFWLFNILFFLGIYFAHCHHIILLITYLFVLTYNFVLIQVIYIFIFEYFIYVYMYF